MLDISQKYNFLSQVNYVQNLILSALITVKPRSLGFCIEPHGIIGERQTIMKTKLSISFGYTGNVLRAPVLKTSYTTVFC